MTIPLTALNSTSAGDIIRAALRKLRTFKPGETLPDSEISDNLEVLNDLIDDFSADKLMLFALTTEPFVLHTNTPQYTIGPNGDFNTARPFFVEPRSCFIRSLGVDYPIYPMTQQEYNSISIKTGTGISGIPLKLWFDPQYPLANITIDPAPTDNSFTLYLVSGKPFLEFPDITTAISFPPGYRRMLVYNLAVELESEYGPSTDPRIHAIAVQTKSAIQHRNAKTIKIDVSGTLRGKTYFNFFRGE